MIDLYKGICIPNRPFPENVARLDMACLPMLSAMESNGMMVDKSYMGDLYKRITGEMGTLAADVEKLAGYSINLGSGDQLADLLFKKLRLKQAGREKWTKSKARLAADSDVLRGMISQHPAIPVIIKWKEHEKLRSSFTLSLIDQADENNRIHCDLNHTGPETGRLSCSEPNLQTIPIRTMLGREIRNAFVPTKGNHIGTVDVSQIEMRTMCHDAKCSNMMELFWQWEDLYWGVAEGMYKRKFNAEDRKHGIDGGSGQTYKNFYRFNAKTTALGVTYDISPEGLVDLFLSADPPAIYFLTGGDSVWDYDKHYNKAVEICGQAIRDFFDGYPEILSRRREHHRRARMHGFVWDLWGRIRWIPQVRSTHNWVVGEGLRAAGNMAGQGGAAGVIKLWMAKLWDRIDEYWGFMGLLPLMTVHDELVVEGPKQVVVDFLEEAKYTIRNLIPYVDLFCVPLEADSDVGERWGSLK